jgi:hypothetical protein
VFLGDLFNSYAYCSYYIKQRLNPHAEKPDRSIGGWEAEVELCDALLNMLYSSPGDDVDMDGDQVADRYGGWLKAVVVTPGVVESRASRMDRIAESLEFASWLDEHKPVFEKAASIHKREQDK